jgi:hypothetical protein
MAESKNDSLSPIFNMEDIINASFKKLHEWKNITTQFKVSNDLKDDILIKTLYTLMKRWYKKYWSYQRVPTYSVFNLFIDSNFESSLSKDKKCILGYKIWKL